MSIANFIRDEYNIGALPTKKKQILSDVFDIAVDQDGYFSARQATAAGVPSIALIRAAKRGDLERVARGVYRIARFPASDNGDYWAAILLPQSEPGKIGAVISHLSALRLHGLTDVNPARIDVSVPTRSRLRKELPRRIRLHRSDVPDREVEFLNGIPTTTTVRTILDLMASSRETDIALAAIQEARDVGKISPKTAKELEKIVSADAGLMDQLVALRTEQLARSKRGAGARTNR